MKKRINNHQRSTIKKVMNYIRRYWGYLGMSIVLAAVTVALTLYLPVLTGRAVDLIIEKGVVDFAGILAILKKMAVIILLTAVAQWIMNACNNKITYNIIRDIRKEAFEKIEKLPLKYIDGHSYGEIVSRVIADVDQFADGLFMGFTQFFTGLMTILGTLLFMVSINPLITLVVVVLTPISLFVASFIAKKTYVMFKHQSETRGELTTLTDEMLGNMKVVQAFGYQKEAEERFQTINNKLAGYSLRATFFSSITNPATRFVNSLVYAAVGITGAYAAIRGFMTVGQLTSFLSYANQYTKPFNEISGVVTELQNALASAARVFELIDEKTILEDKKDATVLENVKGQVEIEHVNFSYTPDRPLIEDLNLSVKPGERVAIVGPTGCGKTTVINLLMRFYDVNSGSIKVEGKDIRDVTRKSLRTSYGMVLQETWLKSGTIRDNIAYGRPEATEEEIINAAKEAHAHSFIMRMPQGYDTVISEDGGNLSQGQKQLLCIARVMLCLPPMLILDEATSALDVSVQQTIIELIVKLQKEKNITIGFICHDISLIQSCSHEVAVMYLGNVVEVLPAEDLAEHAVHPYTRALIGSVFDIGMDFSKPIEEIKGEAPSPLDVPAGCPFRGRCPKATERCAQEKPRLHQIGADHEVACHLFGKEDK